MEELYSQELEWKLSVLTDMDQNSQATITDFCILMINREGILHLIG